MAVTTVDLGNVMGPQGPKGDTGATGPQGPKGDTGASGILSASGDDSTGYYVKYDDGTLLCYRTFNTAVTFTQSGDLHISDWIELGSVYGLTFKSAPNVLININIPWSDSYCAWASGVRGGGTLYPGKFKVISTLPAGGAITVSWVAVGRWK